MYDLIEMTDQIKADSQRRDEKPPWPPDETIDGFVHDISQRRKEASAAWINSIEGQAEGIPSMPADEANRFHSRVSKPPPAATESHLKRATIIARKVEGRLDALSVEWLLEKFKELPPKAKKDFLQRAQKLGDNEK